MTSNLYKFILFYIEGRSRGEVLTNWGNKYGEVYGFRVGGIYVLILNSHSSMREAFMEQGDTFNGRPRTSFMQIANPNHLGFINLFY